MSTLDEIEARIRDCKTYNFGMRNADTLAHFDAPLLLAVVREQVAKLEAVRAIERRLEGSMQGEDREIAEDLRAALEASK